MSDQSTAPAAEQTYVTNAFGTVTNKRVIYFREKGWLKGGSREDIPLQHVTSVRLDISRRILAGGFFLLLTLTSFSIGTQAKSGAGMFWALFAGFWAVVFLWGSPSVVVNTAGRDLAAARGFPWQRNEANAFVEALRGQLFKQ